MFGIGEGELLIIVAFGFMIFGPDKLPGMGRTIGRALRQFRQAQEGFTEVVQAEVMDPLQEAMGDPLDNGTRKNRRATAEERAAALAQDADREDASDEAPVRRESFAERKARLAAERAQREVEQDAAASTATVPAAADAVEAQEASAPVDTASAEPAAVEPKAVDTSAAALYAMGGRSSFAAAKQKAAEEAAAAELAKAEEAAEDAAMPADADSAATDGKEERDA